MEEKPGEITLDEMFELMDKAEWKKASGLMAWVTGREAYIGVLGNIAFLVERFREVCEYYKSISEYRIGAKCSDFVLGCFELGPDDARIKEFYRKREAEKVEEKEEEEKR